MENNVRLSEEELEALRMKIRKVNEVDLEALRRRILRSFCSVYSTAFGTRRILEQTCARV